MNGTDKQIQWAEEIRARVVSVLERLKAERADQPAEVEYADKLIDAINGAEYAGSVINLFKGFRPTGDMQHDVMSLASIYRITRPISADERAILCKD